MSLNLDVDGDNITLKGSLTFNLKEELKKWGGRWDNVNKTWTVKGDPYELRKKLKALIPPSGKYHCYYCGSYSEHPTGLCKINLNKHNRKHFLPKEKGCYCSEKYVCLPCAVACCTNIEPNQCVCHYSFRCKEHNDGRARCFGSHE